MKPFKDLPPGISSQENKYFICPDCRQRFPIIRSITKKDNEEYVYIQCICGEKIVKLNEYIEEIKNVQPNTSEMCYNPRHYDKRIGVEYCPTCHKWFCDSCLGVHDDMLMNHNSFFFEMKDCEKIQYKEEPPLKLPSKTFENWKRYFVKIVNDFDLANRQFIDKINGAIMKLGSYANIINNQYEKCITRINNEINLFYLLFNTYTFFPNDVSITNNLKKFNLSPEKVTPRKEKFETIWEELENYVSFLKRNTLFVQDDDQKRFSTI